PSNPLDIQACCTRDPRRPRRDSRFPLAEDSPMDARTAPASAMNQGALTKATITGTLLQVIMVVVGHFVPAVASSFPVVGTGIGAVTGYLFSKWGGRPTRMASASGGALAGGVAGMLGTVLSAALGDVP